MWPNWPDIGTRQREINDPEPSCPMGKASQKSERLWWLGSGRFPSRETCARSKWYMTCRIAVEPHATSRLSLEFTRDET